MNVLLGMNSRSYKGFKIGIMATLFTVLAAFNPTPFETENEEVNIIVIDAGHGGHDPGNLGTGRYRKKRKMSVMMSVSCLRNTLKKTSPVLRWFLQEMTTGLLNSTKGP